MKQQIALVEYLHKGLKKRLKKDFESPSVIPSHHLALKKIRKDKG